MKFKIKFISQREVLEQTRKSAFGARPTIAFRDKAKYSRKEKFKGKGYSDE